MMRLPLAPARPQPPVQPRSRSRAANLVVDGFTKWYRTGAANVHALDDISLEIGNGEFVCLVGASGCGKSTLLDIMAGLTKADAGRVLADGEPVVGPGRQRLVMFQEPALFPWLTAFGNVMFGLKLRHDLGNRERREIAWEHLVLVGLDEFAYANIHELSGGMKQRVALARALAPDPQVMLMDEPFAALDAMTRDQLYGDIQRIWSESGKTIVFVTHDVREEVCLGDRVLLMSPRPGHIGREFKISLPRPRDINSPALAELAAQTAAALKEAGAASR